MEEEKIVNVNIGIIGHVDSGKTSIAKALSTVGSTAAFDKNPQSQARGITLDLGFSSLTVDLPARFRDTYPQATQLQLTFVDCPGHASLIRTILGGAQIMDMMLLVVDAVKGMQTQTGEGIVIGEISTQTMVVALNKIDQFDADARAAAVAKAEARVRAAIRRTVFADAPMVPLAAAAEPPLGVDALCAKLVECAPVPRRDRSGPFVFAVDHAFPIRGQGTVLTGTVLSGRIAVNQPVEIAGRGLERKVKSIQRFRQPVNSAAQGDRVGLCVTQFDAADLERGLVCSPGAVPLWHGTLCVLERIAYYPTPVTSKGKYHITVGHQTVMASLRLFGAEDDQAVLEPASREALLQGAYVLREELVSSRKAPVGSQWCTLEFETPVLAPREARLIGARLDMDIHSPTCRIAFHGRLHFPWTKGGADDMLRLYKWKERSGTVLRVHDETTAIAKGFFTKAVHLDRFLNQPVRTESGLVGVIESTFGQGDKVRVRFTTPIDSTLLPPGTKLTLRFQKFQS